MRNFIIAILLSEATLNCTAQYVLTNPTASQTVTQPIGTSLQVFGGNGLEGNPTNGIFIATSYSGVDAAAKINECLTAATQSGKSEICDATGLNGAQILGSNAFAGIYGSFDLILASGTQFTINVTQQIIGAYQKIEKRGSFGPDPTFKWAGAAGGTIFDIKDAPDFQMNDIFVDGNGIAGSCILMSGGLINIFDTSFNDVFVQNCRNADFDNSTNNNYLNVSLAKSGSTVSGTLSGGQTFPSNWVGSSANVIAISNATSSDYNTTSFITINPTSGTTFTAAVPQGSIRIERNRYGVVCGRYAGLDVLSLFCCPFKCGC